jgi:hypothetical protein
MDAAVDGHPTMRPTGAAKSLSVRIQRERSYFCSCCAYASGDICPHIGTILGSSQKPLVFETLGGHRIISDANKV